MSRKRQAQGSLEYIIIIAAVLGILTVVIVMSTGIFTGQKGATDINACKQAASQCKVTLYSVPNDPCLQCDSACNVSGTEVFQNALGCCKSGRPDMIYQGSSGCGLPGCGDNLKNRPNEECDGSDSASCPGACTATCTCPSFSVTITSPSAAYTPSYTSLTATTPWAANCYYGTAPGPTTPMTLGQGATTHVQTLIGLTSGSKTYYIRCVAGSKSNESSKTWIVDANPPTITSLTPSNNSIISGTTSIVLQATDTGSGVESASFYYRTVGGKGTTLCLEVPAAKNIVCDFDTTLRPNEAGIIGVTVEDNVLLTNYTEINVFISNGIMLGITSPTAGEITGSSVTLTATTNDNANCYYGTAPHPTTTMASTGGTTHTQSLTGLTNGFKNYYVSCNDSSAPYVFNETNRTWTVDTAPPTIALTSPTNNSIVNGTITLSATASDIGSGVGYVTFNVLRTDASKGGTDFTYDDYSSPYSVQFNTTTVVDKNYRVWAEAYDKAGYSNSTPDIIITISNNIKTTITSPMQNTGPNAYLNATTTKAANCYYGTSPNPTTAMSTGQGTLTHSQYLTGLNGQVTYYLSCNDSSQPSIFNQTSKTWTAVARTEIFYDEFATLDAWAGDKPPWLTFSSFGNSVPYNSSLYALKYGYGTHVINHTQSTTGYQNINMSFWAIAHESDAGEYMKMDWFNGTAWTNLYTATSQPETWSYHSYLLPASANNKPNLIIKVYCYCWHNPPGSDYCAVDTFRITGSSTVTG